jgi:hypothetical protein
MTFEEIQQAIETMLQVQRDLQERQFFFYISSIESYGESNISRSLINYKLIYKTLRPINFCQPKELERA